MKALTFSVALLATSISFSQNVVYFPGFELINMRGSEDLQYSTSKLIKSYIEDNHDFTVILDEELRSGAYAKSEALSISAKKADQQGIRYMMLGEIHHLQGIYVVSLGLYEAQTLKRVWHDMVKGAAEQDLDALLSRLGRTFFTNKTAKTDIEIDEVTKYDQQGVELAQIKVNHYAGIKLGGKFISDEAVLSGFGLMYTYDASTILFNLDFEYYPTSSLFLDHHSEERRMQTGNIKTE